MNIIEQARKGLEELSRPGLVQGRECAHAQADREPPPVDAQTVAPITCIDDGIQPPTHVMLDLDRLERTGHIVASRKRSSVSEEFRHIKRLLVQNARSRDAVAHRLALVMVTSALPAEGKTFCAINLAMSLAAEIDTSVLLVDADVVRPAPARPPGAAPDKGLLDLLADPGLDLSRLVRKTNVPKLSILPAGTRTPFSTELFASAAMDALLVSLARRDPDCLVIFDAPPLLVTNEAQVLAARVGQIVLVVEASKTPRSAIEQAFAALQPYPVVMSVLNKAQGAAVKYGYGYGYGHG